MNKEEKTLVILTPAFPLNEADENWVPSQQLFLRSVKKLFPGVKIIVLSFIYPSTTANYQWNGIPVFSFDGMKYRRFRRPLLWRKIWKKLNEINKVHKIEAILSFWCSECALVGRYFGKRNSVKHFTWICGQDARKKNKLVKLIRPLPGELIAKSDFLADEFFRNHGIGPEHIIPNGIDPSNFPALPSVRDIDVIGVGSFNSVKRYDLFVEIVAGLKKSIPGIKAVLCGDGEMADHIKRMREEYSVTDKLTLTGMLSPADAIRMMQRAKILLHPSSYEGFSMACLEALYAGAHVISFVKPMHHDIKNWHIVKTKEQMQQKALELLYDPQTVYEPVLVYLVDDSTEQMMELLGLSD